MIPGEWLTCRLDTLDPDELALRDLRALGLSPDDAHRLLERARPRWHERWFTFLAQRAPGDEVWAFESPRETWRELAGAAGYALVRKGQVVERLVTRRS